MAGPNVIVIGAGPSGISLAHTLKHKLGFNDFTVYEKLDGVGGTWRTNTYPGVGCDVPTILYSFSFNLNPDWSKELCDGPEILEYMEATVDKYDLRKHMHFGFECLGAKWNTSTLQWDVRFRDLRTNLEVVRSATALVSAVGGISYPRDVKFEGMEKFQGEMFHTARWNHNFDYRGKRMAVIGNGCSAAQVVPSVVKDAGFVKQYARSPQWYHERPNRPFTAFETWCFRYIPLWERWQRLSLFLENDDLVSTYMPGMKAATKRAKVEDHAKKYIFSRAPEKYHNFLIPDFPLGGCLRDGKPEHTNDFDVIVLATGFQVQQFLTPMEVVGKTGQKTLAQQWKEHRGAQAYMGSFVHNFPNFAILFGPNTFPAHNSALFSCEVQIEYVARTLLAPLVDQKASVIEVKSTAENQWVNSVHGQLKGSVFQAGCSNWYINEHGRNAASWPGYASTYWKETLIPRYGVFIKKGGSRLWPLYTMLRWLKTTRPTTYGLCLMVAGLLAWQKNISFKGV